MDGQRSNSGYLTKYEVRQSSGTDCGVKSLIGEISCQGPPQALLTFGRARSTPDTATIPPRLRSYHRLPRLKVSAAQSCFVFFLGPTEEVSTGQGISKEPREEEY
jgi:hypothetical protein